MKGSTFVAVDSCSFSGDRLPVKRLGLLPRKNSHSADISFANVPERTKQPLSVLCVVKHPDTLVDQLSETAQLRNNDREPKAESLDGRSQGHDLRERKYTNICSIQEVLKLRYSKVFGCLDHDTIPTFRLLDNLLTVGLVEGISHCQKKNGIGLVNLGECLKQILDTLVASSIPEIQVDKVSFQKPKSFAGISPGNLVRKNIDEVSMRQDGDVLLPEEQLSSFHCPIVTMGYHEVGQSTDKKPRQMIDIGKRPLVGIQVMECPNDSVTEGLSVCQTFREECILPNRLFESLASIEKMEPV